MLDTSTTPARHASIAVVRSAGRIRRAIEALCVEHGLTAQQFNVLSILRGARRAGERPLPTMTVGERMVEPEPGITRLMGRLQAKGLVQRVRCPSDARCVRCSITPAGLAALEALDAPFAALEADLFAGLSSADLSLLTDLLSRAQPDPSCPT